ncbi:hypothetical protein BAE44_0020374 [Dichanthelium oligosanthes]|uniref:SHSP domain-containing protein n=1 Tax=Dichanthelium oligosanthes TaxID=888268 RepID=A0A1E5V0I2_9POAL|nr:hypothetical protein BAE44_0020374 [Dichanthelium oligosanthes]
MDRANNRAYEEYDPTVEWSRSAELDSVKIILPGKQEIDDDTASLLFLDLLTEKIMDDGWSRFQKDFQLPDNCNVDGIRAKFENDTLTITLPKKTPSPTSAPVTPQPPRMPVPEPPRMPVAAPSQRIPPALPEPAARPAAPPTVPAAPLAPAASQRQPPERRPSLPRKPSAVEPAPELPARLPSVPTPALQGEPQRKYNGGAAAATKPEPSREEEKRLEREMMGKMEEDRKAAQEREKAKEQQGEAAMGEMAMQPRPASASRGLIVNVAVAVVVLLGITVYVWHTLRNATGGAGGHGHGHGHLGAGSHRDEMCASSSSSSLAAAQLGEHLAAGEAHLGFKEEDIRVLMDNHGIIAVRGKRPIAGTRWSRFQKDFKVPDNCNAASMLISKFQNETLTITFPKETPKPPASP